MERRLHKAPGVPEIHGGQLVHQRLGLEEADLPQLLAAVRHYAQHHVLQVGAPRLRQVLGAVELHEATHLVLHVLGVGGHEPRLKKERGMEGGAFGAASCPCRSCRAWRKPP